MGAHREHPLVPEERDTETGLRQENMITIYYIIITTISLISIHTVFVINPTEMVLYH